MTPSSLAAPPRMLREPSDGRDQKVTSGSTIRRRRRAAAQPAPSSRSTPGIAAPERDRLEGRRSGSPRAATQRLAHESLDEFVRVVPRSRHVAWRGSGGVGPRDRRCMHQSVRRCIQSIPRDGATRCAGLQNESSPSLRVDSRTARASELGERLQRRRSASAAIVVGQLDDDGRSLRTGLRHIDPRARPQ